MAYILDPMEISLMKEDADHVGIGNLQIMLVSLMVIDTADLVTDILFASRLIDKHCVSGVCCADFISNVEDFITCCEWEGGSEMFYYSLIIILLSAIAYIIPTMKRLNDLRAPHNCLATNNLGLLGFAIIKVYVGCVPCAAINAIVTAGCGTDTIGIVSFVINGVGTLAAFTIIVKFKAYRMILSLACALPAIFIYFIFLVFMMLGIRGRSQEICDTNDDECINQFTTFNNNTCRNATSQVLDDLYKLNDDDGFSCDAAKYLFGGKIGDD